MRRNLPDVSIVIPVWRDAEQLKALLASPALAAAADVIVACTADEEVDVAALAPPACRVVTAAPGRATQMNAGAAAASAEWILFLHVDSRLPAGWHDALAVAAADARVVAGAFRFALDSQDVRARILEWGVRYRTRWFNLPYGDQGLFVRRQVFEQLGGFRKLPLMEDVDLVRRLRRVGRLHYSNLSVVTSARRWRRAGWLRGVLTNWALMAAYSGGISPRRLARIYRHRHRHAVAVVGRDPRAPGKSRIWDALAQPADPALTIALLADTMAAVDRIGGIDKVFVHTGARRAVMEFCPEGWTTLGQRGGDLGERMANAFEDLFALGHDCAVLIGSDVPSLPEHHVHNAFQQLRAGADVVLGPSDDGGFYLIGLRNPQPGLFVGIPWSTAHVFSMTCGRARALGLKLGLVERWYDVDDPETLRRSAREAAPRTLAWARARSLVP